MPTGTSERSSSANVLAFAATGAGCAAAAIGLLVLAGWLVGSQALIRIAPELPPMVLATALGMALTGLALATAAVGRAGWATLAAGLGAALCLATLAEHAAGSDFGIDDFLVPGASALVVEQGGRMPLNTAVALLLCNIAVLSRTLGRGPAAHPGLRGVLGALALAVGLAGLLGFVLGVPGTYQWGGLTASMALHSAVGVLSLGIGILAWAWHDDAGAAGIVPLWAPLIALLAGAAVTFMLWLAVETQQREAAQQRVQNSVTSIANLVSRGVEEPIRALGRMAVRLRSPGVYGEGLWRTDVQAYQTDFSGLRGVVMVRPDGTAASEPPLEPGLLERVRADLAAAMRASMNQVAPGAVSLGFGPWSDGQDVVYMAVPQAGSMGSVVGALDMGALTEHVLSGIARPYYTLRILKGAEELYRSAGEARFAGDGEVAAAMPLSVVGPDWSIEVAATDAAARGVQSGVLPWVILIAGMLMSALLAVAILMGRYAQINRLRAEQRLAELRHAQGRMVRLNSDLEESNRELEAFAYSVSHDLRAPLRHVAGFVELLEANLAGKGIGDQGQRYLNIIRDAAVRMGTLIDDLLAFSRVGRTQIEPVPVDLNKLVQEIRDEAQHDTRGRSIEWGVGALPVLQADRNMMRLALGNLIGNAIKFTRQRSPARIAVEAQRQDENVVIAVRDNGVGFDPKYADKLFGVFQRLHRAEEFEGTGIGLANVRRIVLRHGGRTWAESTPGQGASFYCSFPAAAASLAPTPDKETS